MKAVRLSAMLFRAPAEFRGRAAAIIQAHVDRYLHRPVPYPIQDWDSTVSRLAALLRSDLAAILREPGLHEFERDVELNLRAPPPQAPFGRLHNADFRLARLCYAVARTLRPRVVVETGVCYGVTSAFLLKALDVNDEGSLYSVDLPPLGKRADSFVGCVIPPSLTERWRLVRGLSKNLLPELLPELGTVDVFVHDSLHTYQNMRREFELVTPYLGRPSALISDDVEGNSAFQEWVERYRPDFSAVVREESKGSLLGIGVFVRNAQALGIGE
jgi:hypothetical protein